MTFQQWTDVDFWIHLCAKTSDRARTDAGYRTKIKKNNTAIPPLSFSFLFISTYNNSTKNLFLIHLHLYTLKHIQPCPTEKATTHPSTPTTTTTTHRTNSSRRDSNPRPTPLQPHPHRPTSLPTRSPALLLSLLLLLVQPRLVSTPRSTTLLSSSPTSPRTSTPNSTTTQSLLQAQPVLHHSPQASRPTAWRRR